ncbi:hypothetical protein MUTS15_14210 [Escherichia coli]|nr:hypothetical protein MUTS15_14210 [Escherichia coli]
MIFLKMGGENTRSLFKSKDVSLIIGKVLLTCKGISREKYSFLRLALHEKLHLPLNMISLLRRSV